MVVDEGCQGEFQIPINLSVRVEVQNSIDSLLDQQIFEEKWLNGCAQLEDVVFECEVKEVGDLELADFDELERLSRDVDLPLESVYEKDIDSGFGMMSPEGTRPDPRQAQIVSRHDRARGERAARPFGETLSASQQGSVEVGPDVSGRTVGVPKGVPLNNLRGFREAGILDFRSRLASGSGIELVGLVSDKGGDCCRELSVLAFSLVECASKAVDVAVLALDASLRALQSGVGRIELFEEDD